MNNSKLTPGVSTCFRWVSTTTMTLTEGKVYKIIRWVDNAYFFDNDMGDTTAWWGQHGVEDVSYEENLEKILE